MAAEERDIDVFGTTIAPAALDSSTGAVNPEAVPPSSEEPAALNLLTMQRRVASLERDLEEMRYQLRALGDELRMFRPGSLTGY